MESSDMERGVGRAGVEFRLWAAADRGKAQQRTAVRRRRMFSVALLGPDGVGKTTIARRLVETSALPAQYLYIGPNYDAANYVLPITRWWVKRAQRAAGETAAQGATTQRRSVRKSIRRWLGGVHGLLQGTLHQLYLHLVARYLLYQGYVVVFDRHLTLDYQLTLDREKQPFSLRRGVRWVLYRAVCPDPDLVICLDAPPEVVFARKQELSLAVLAERRRQYRSLDGKVKHLAVVDASRDLELVVDDVRQVVSDFDRNFGRGGS
jgi:thymidylate kinase